MEAASTSAVSVNFYQTTRRNNLEDSHLRTNKIQFNTVPQVFSGRDFPTKIMQAFLVSPMLISWNFQVLLVIVIHLAVSNRLWTP
jgi:hypothetical protein